MKAIASRLEGRRRPLNIETSSLPLGHVSHVSHVFTLRTFFRPRSASVQSRFQWLGVLEHLHFKWTWRTQRHTFAWDPKPQLLFCSLFFLCLSVTSWGYIVLCAQTKHQALNLPLQWCSCTLKLVPLYLTNKVNTNIQKRTNMSIAYVFHHLPTVS